LDIAAHLATVFSSGEYLRPNKYEATITPPPSVTATSEFLRRVSVNCRSAVLPGRAIETKEHGQGGFVVRKMAHSQQYTDLSLTFYLSEDLLEKRLFDAWQDSMFDPVYQNVGYYKDYAAGVVTVKPLSRAGRAMPTYKFYECWPLSVNDVQVAYDLDNQVAGLDVTFAYHHWELEEG